MTGGGRATVLVLLAGLLSAVVAGVAPATAGQPVEGRGRGDAGRGEQLYTTGCSSCHGLGAEGTRRAPSLLGVGAAAVDFWVSTGRMPLETSRRVQAVRKPPAYDREQIDDLIAYVTGLAPGGPPIPRLERAEVDLVEGGTLFRANCAACHGAVGVGGALASSRQAPALRPADAVEIAEAIRIGPGAMPGFGPETFTDDQVASIVAYVEYLDHPEDRGGTGLGHTGPIPEGFVGWLAGLGSLLLACYWIGERE